MLRRPKTLLDVPSGVMLLVFERLGFKDRIALAQTCRQLRDLAYSEGVFSHEKHVIRSPRSATSALVHRAKNVQIHTADGVGGVPLRVLLPGRHEVSHRQPQAGQGLGNGVAADQDWDAHPVHRKPSPGHGQRHVARGGGPH